MISGDYGVQSSFDVLKTKIKHFIGRCSEKKLDNRKNALSSTTLLFILFQRGEKVSRRTSQ